MMTIAFHWQITVVSVGVHLGPVHPAAGIMLQFSLPAKSQTAEIASEQALHHI